MSALFGPADIPRPPRVVRPGAVWIPGFLDPAEQRRIVADCREIGRGPVPFHHTPIGAHRMSTMSTGVGWHWTQDGYRRHAADVNGREVLAVPAWMVDLGRRAVAAAARLLPEPELFGIAAADFTVDAALLNFYARTAQMGMHQDRHELSAAPIVSLSIGESCTFRFGNTEHRHRPYTDIQLASGDLFVFGGPSRLAFHGVPAIRPGTAPPDCGLDTGRLNLTLRHTGLSACTGTSPEKGRTG